MAVENAVEKALVRPLVNLGKEVSHDVGSMTEDAANAVAKVVENIELPHDKLSFSEEMKGVVEKLKIAAEGPNLSPDAYTSIAIPAADHGDLGEAHKYFTKAIDRIKSTGSALKILKEITAHWDTSVQSRHENVTPGFLNLLKEALTKGAQHVDDPKQLQDLLGHANNAHKLAEAWKPSVRGIGDKHTSFKEFLSGAMAFFSVGTVPVARKQAMIRSVDKISDFAILQAASQAKTVEAAKEIATFAEGASRYESAEIALQRAHSLAEVK